MAPPRLAWSFVMAGRTALGACAIMIGPMRKYRLRRRLRRLASRNLVYSWVTNGLDVAFLDRASAPVRSLAGDPREVNAPPIHPLPR